MPKTLTSTALEATRWNYAGFVTRGLASLVVGIVLARLLGPKPFGQIGVAMIIYGLGNLLADAGFSSAIVQTPDLDVRQVQFAFTIQILFGCALTLLVWSIAPLVGNAVSDPGVVAVVRAVAPIFVLQAFGQTATGMLKRQMRFRPIQIAQITSYLVGYAVVGVAMAYAGSGVWSLVAAQLAQSFLYSLVVYLKVRHSVRPHLNRSGLPLLRFGAQITGANLINWGISNLDNVVVGRVFGSTSLGLYSRAFSLANVPVEGFVGTCQQVLFASCSRVELGFERMRRAYLAVLSGIALVTLPTFWSLALCGQPVILGLYGGKWVHAVPLFTAFAVAMPFFALMAIAGPVLAAANQVHQEIRTQAWSLVVAIALFGAGSRVSVAAVAWTVPVAYAFRFWFTTRPALRLLGLRWRDIGAVVTGPIVAGAFTAVCVYGMLCLIRTIGVPPTVAVVALMTAGLCSFFAVTLVGGAWIVPAAVTTPVLTRTANIPAWLVRRFQPLAVEPEVG